MSRRRVYHEETIGTMKRFFEALHKLSESGLIKGGITGYCKLHNIDKRHLYAQESELNRGYFEISWIIPLIRDYRVSSAWLLMDIGPMYV